MKAMGLNWPETPLVWTDLPDQQPDLARFECHERTGLSLS
jgi:hypothetical protein